MFFYHHQCGAMTPMRKDKIILQPRKASLSGYSFIMTKASEIDACVILQRIVVNHTALSCTIQNERW